MKKRGSHIYRPGASKSLLDHKVELIVDEVQELGYSVTADATKHLIRKCPRPYALIRNVSPREIANAIVVYKSLPPIPDRIPMPPGVKPPPVERHIPKKPRKALLIKALATQLLNCREPTGRSKK